MRDILAGVRDHIATDPELHLVFPMHPNPEVRAAARDILAGTPNVKLVEPAGYRSFIALMQGAELIVTDSGGIQEEAPTLGKHTLVLRASTERSEGVAAGTATLVGVDRMAVREAIGAYYQSPPPAPTMNPFGDGHASERIVDVLESKYR
jgi:UDP-N-acetylglucosamine 2-epimerase (non-hydrolysing)